MKKQNKILALVAMILAIGTMVALPCFAYEVNPLNTPLGYTVVPVTFTVDVNGDTLYSDTIPYSFYDERDVSSDVWEVYYNDGFAEYQFFDYGYTTLGTTYKLNFPTLTFRDEDNALTALTIFNVASVDITWYGVNSGGVTDGTRYTNSWGNNGTSFDVGSFFADMLSGYEFIIFEMSATTYLEGGVRLPIYDGSTILSDIPINVYTKSDGVVVSPIDNVPIGEFLWNSVTGFLGFEIAEGIQLYDILLALVALPLLMWFLKLVAGG